MHYFVAVGGHISYVGWALFVGGPCAARGPSAAAMKDL